MALSRNPEWGDAADVLEKAVRGGQVESAVLHIEHRGTPSTFHFGKAKSPDAKFLLGSISKPINVAAMMTLFDKRLFRLDDKVKKFLPDFTGEGRDEVTIGHLLTHLSGLPDQLANNGRLRRNHAPLSEFVAETMRTPLAFAPGSKYSYSSMGILLATRIAEVVGEADILTLVDKAIFQPLAMKHSAQGLGAFKQENLIACQMDGAAPESGGGDPQSIDWNWNSAYWRKLGAPWGGTHASAPDVARFLNEFLFERGVALKPETARLMIQNHNPPMVTSRGLGFAVGKGAGSAGCSDQTFGHTGSTGTLCWADPATQTVCVVLTSLPSRAAQPHPYVVTGEKVTSAIAASR